MIKKEILYEKMHSRPIFLMKQNAPQAKFVQQNATQALFF